MINLKVNMTTDEPSDVSMAKFNEVFKEVRYLFSTVDIDVDRYVTISAHDAKGLPEMPDVWAAKKIAVILANLDGLDPFDGFKILKRVELMLTDQILHPSCPPSS